MRLRFKHTSKCLIVSVIQEHILYPLAKPFGKDCELSFYTRCPFYFGKQYGSICLYT